MNISRRLNEPAPKRFDPTERLRRYLATCQSLETTEAHRQAWLCAAYDYASDMKNDGAMHSVRRGHVTLDEIVHAFRCGLDGEE